MRRIPFAPPVTFPAPNRNWSPFVVECLEELEEEERDDREVVPG